MQRRKFIKGSAIIGATVAGGTLALSSSGMLQKDSARTVRQILNSDRTMVGTLPIIRAFAGDHLDYVSPYVLFDEFGPVQVQAGADPLRVDAHPHAGVIPTTYFLQGSGHHKDSLNYDIQIGRGDFMMFSSGRGAIHMEETGQTLTDRGGAYHGFQIWLNMPSAHKFIAPTTSVSNETQMGVVNHKDYSIKVVLGEVLGAKSKIDLLTPAFYWHVKLNPGARLDLPTEPTHNAFVYSVNGEVELEGNQILKTNQIALFNREASDIRLYSPKGSELLVLGGQPLNEPVYSYGPFVMNTQEQINLCIQNYQQGKMGNPSYVN